MRRLLIISPHFPPTDAVDMHRVRMNVGYYRSFGWDPTVLAVHPEATGRLIDPKLSRTVPNDVKVVYTGALSEKLTRPLGFGALGFRAHRQMAAAGDKLVQTLRPDLAFFSTTSFPIMTLGPRWRRRFGLPFVIDLQDPWYTAPASTRPFHGNGARVRLMRSIHRHMERVTMKRVDGLIAVSPHYLPPLIKAFPRLAALPLEAIPFGHSAADLEAGTRYGEPLDVPLHTAGCFTLLCAGRAGDDLRPALETLFGAMRRAQDQGDGPAASFRTLFLGTGYQRENNPPQIAPLGARAGIGNRAVERPDRVALLDVQRALATADALLVLGSADLAYQPSKLYQYLATDRPVLCVAPAGAQFATGLGDLEGVLLLEAGAPLELLVHRLNEWLLRFAGKAVTDAPKRIAATQGLSAAALARRECALFDRVVQEQG